MFLLKINGVGAARHSRSLMPRPTRGGKGERSDPFVFRAGRFQMDKRGVIWSRSETSDCAGEAMAEIERITEMSEDERSRRA